MVPSGINVIELKSSYCDLGGESKSSSALRNAFPTDTTMQDYCYSVVIPEEQKRDILDLNVWDTSRYFNGSNDTNFQMK